MAAENKRLATRMASELRSLATAPPPGVLCYARGDSLTQLEAVLAGPAGTVYEGGVFRLDVVVPSNYPFAPPLVTFRTPVYHPNIDAGGRICLDILNSKPKGAWTPSLSVALVLTGIISLLSHPNADDGLMSEIAAEYKNSRSLFDGKAREHTRLHASAQAIGGKGEARGRESASAGEPVEEKEDEPPAKLVRRESAAAAPS